ncbi:MAG: hypothetical protein K6B41_07995, partial [Butyrivibrio sp.]|nr:hypothetical protein [Butyrivibrio sp.]
MIRRMKRSMAFVIATALAVTTLGSDVNSIGTFAAEEVLVEEVSSEVESQSLETESAESVEEVL